MTSTHAANVRSDGTHPRHRLEQQLLHAVRFSIVATLAATDLAEFRFVRDTVEISDSFLSKQVALLEGTGFLSVQKGYSGKRPRTWLRLTSRGRTAYERHLDALQAIAYDR